MNSSSKTGNTRRVPKLEQGRAYGRIIDIKRGIKRLVLNADAVEGEYVDASNDREYIP